MDPLGTIANIIAISDWIRQRIDNRKDLPGEAERLQRTVDVINKVANHAKSLVLNNGVNPESIQFALQNLDESLNECKVVIEKYIKRPRLFWIFVAGSYMEKFRKADACLFADLGTLQAAMGAHVAVDVGKLIENLKQFRNEFLTSSQRWRELLVRSGWAGMGGVGMSLVVVLLGGRMLRRSMSKPVEPAAIAALNDFIQTGAKVMREAPKEARSWIANLQE